MDLQTFLKLMEGCFNDSGKKKMRKEKVFKMFEEGTGFPLGLLGGNSYFFLFSLYNSFSTER